MNKLFLLPFLAVLLCGCLEETCNETRTVIGFEPVTTTAGEWRANSSFFCGVGQPVCTASGFYVYEDYLFMVEENKGLHIYDNGNPSDPVPITFMEAPGGQGLAVRNGILYMNQYTDLVAFDLSDPTRPELVGRTEDVFEPYSVFAQVLPNDEFVVDWVETGEQRNLTCNSPNFGNRSFWQDDILFANSSADFATANVNNSSGGGQPETVGQGGSLARFTISNRTLYAVDDQRLKVFDLTDAENPRYADQVNLGWGIETIFPSGDNLYIGSTTGMHIYNVSTPTAPEHLSTFQHVLSCDPVVVAGDLAYVTLWGGRDCGSTGDQLEIIDVSDPRNPESLQITPMSSSHGLGVAEGKLFLCAQWEGLKVFDLDHNGLLGEQLSVTTGINARDVIVLPEDNELIVLGYGQDGIQQFNYTDGGQVTANGKIEVCVE